MNMSLLKIKLEKKQLERGVNNLLENPNYIDYNIITINALVISLLHKSTLLHGSQAKLIQRLLSEQCFEECQLAVLIKRDARLLRVMHVVL